MQCPECQSSYVNKNGHKKGKQNYICVNCARQFIDCYQPHKGYSWEVKRECLQMYVNGLGFRVIERMKGGIRSINRGNSKKEGSQSRHSMVEYKA